MYVVSSFSSQKKLGAAADSTLTDDPELWHNAPISLQLVGKQFEDERLLAVAAAVDEAVNGNENKTYSTERAWELKSHL